MLGQANKVGEEAGPEAGALMEGEAAASKPAASAVGRASERPHRLGVLRHKHYRNIFVASFISNIGGWMEMVGIQMIVAKATGSLTMLGYFAAAQLLPILFLGILGGLLADRVNRKKLLVFTQAMLMLIAAGVAAAAYWSSELPSFPFVARMSGHELAPGATDATGLVVAMFLLSLMQGTVMAFNIPAWQVLTPRLVPREELTKAITLQGIQFNLARVIGPGIAGWVSGIFGATPLFMVNAVTFLGVLIAVTTTPAAPAPRRSEAPVWPEIQGAAGRYLRKLRLIAFVRAAVRAMLGSAARELREAAAFIFRQKGPLCVFLAMVMMSLLAAPLMRMLPLYVIDVFGMKDAAADTTTGNLISVLGIGAVLGGLLLKYVPVWYPKHHFIPVAITGAGLSITIFGLTGTVFTGYLAMFVVGLFWIWGFNPAWAAMQNLVTDEMRGRVLAIANVAVFGVTALGNIGAGWLGEGVQALARTGRLGGWAAAHATEVGTHTAVVGLSAVLFCAGLVMLIWRVPEVDGLRPGHPEYGPRRSLIGGITARAHLEQYRQSQGRCRRCGHDLRGAGGKCPECGLAVGGTSPAWEPETHAGAK